jgi:hypothetical protein
MTPILQFTTLALATMFAAAGAVAFDYLLLRAAFRLMRPATAHRARMSRSALVSGTTRLAQAFAPYK